MLPLEVMITFSVAALVLALVPGPDNFYVLSVSALQGRVSGYCVILGLCTGLILHSMAVALGAAVIFQTSALAFTLLKYCGAAYLVYLAWQTFRSRGEGNGCVSVPRARLRSLYTRGILMNISNPKVSLFFLAFLPQFADPARGSIPLQIVLLGGLFILSTILVFGAIASLAGAAGACLGRRPGLYAITRNMAALVFLALAARLITAQR